MELNRYQEESRKFSLYQKHGDTLNVVYPALALCGEAGEVANDVKKILREHGKIPAPLDPKLRNKIVDELGDVLWYVAAVAADLGEDLEKVAQLNILKLIKRKEDRELLDGIA